MDKKRGIIILNILIVVVTAAALCIYFALSPPFQSLISGRAAHDDKWEVQRVGGMAFDDQHSNIYLTSTSKSKSRVDGSEDRVSAMCLIQMLSFSPEEGFASLNHGVLTGKSGFLHGFFNLPAACPDNPTKCWVRRHLQDDFHQVDEHSYAETCPDVYVRSNKAILLGRLPEQEDKSVTDLGLVTIMNLDANKIGGNDAQQIQLSEEPLAVVMDDEKTIYLAAKSRGHSDSIFLSRYSKVDGPSWRLDWKESHLISKGALKVDIVNMDVILGGQFLVLAGRANHGHGVHSMHFGIYDSNDGSRAKVHDTSNALKKQHGQKHVNGCVCIDQQESNANVAVLYEVSTIVIQKEMIATVNKIQIAHGTTRKKHQKHELSQTPIWTEVITHASMMKCHLPKNDEDALVLGGYVQDGHQKGVFAITKRLKSDGSLIWLTKESAWKDMPVTHVRLAGIAMDKQNNILVYGQDSGQGSNDDGDVALLLALDGATGNVLAQTNSPAMISTRVASTSSSSLQSRSSPEIMPRAQGSYSPPVLLICLSVVVAAIVAFIVFTTCQSLFRDKDRKAFEIRVLDVFYYMAPFKAMDVDVQQSPSGGFNATYSEVYVDKLSGSVHSGLSTDSAEDGKKEPTAAERIRRKASRRMERRQNQAGVSGDNMTTGTEESTEEKSQRKSEREKAKEDLEAQRSKAKKRKEERRLLLSSQL